MTGIEALNPAPRCVTVAGREIELRPVRIVDTPRFAAALKRVWGYLAEDRLLDALTEDYEAVRDILIIGAGLRGEEADGLDLAEYLDLATGVFEVNLDFFTRRVRPELERMAAVLEMAMTGADGPISSPGSSSAGTAVTTAAE